MGSKDSNYQVVYRYEPLMKYIPGAGCCFSGQNPAAAGSGWVKPMMVFLCLNLIAPFPLVRG